MKHENFRTQCGDNTFSHSVSMLSLCLIFHEEVYTFFCIHIKLNTLGYSVTQIASMNYRTLVSNKTVCIVFPENASQLSNICDISHIKAFFKVSVFTVLKKCLYIPYSRAKLIGRGTRVSWETVTLPINVFIAMYWGLELGGWGCTPVWDRGEGRWFRWLRFVHSDVQVCLNYLKWPIRHEDSVHKWKHLLTLYRQFKFM